MLLRFQEKYLNHQLFDFHLDHFQYINYVLFVIALILNLLVVYYLKFVE